MQLHGNFQTPISAGHFLLLAFSCGARCGAGLGQRFAQSGLTECALAAGDCALL